MIYLHLLLTGTKAFSKNRPSYVFFADTEAEMEEWIQIITAFIALSATPSVRTKRHSSFPRVVDFSKMEKEGYLTKRGGMVKNWKTRWFVLKANYLYYYKNQESVKVIKLPLSNETGN